MRVVFMGTSSFAVPPLEAIATRHFIPAVYCRSPRPAGRGQKPCPSPIQLAAESLNLTICTPTTLKNSEEQSRFQSFGADVVVVAAYGLLLPSPILEAPRLGCVNIHASLLPRWRGAAPIQRAIMNGDAETGITIMQMEEGLDSGPILLQQSMPIGPTDVCGFVHDALSRQGASLILDALDQLETGTARAVSQPGQGVTYAAKIEKTETGIDWSRPAVEVARRINGLSPFPGAWFDWGGERVKVLHAAVEPGEPGAAPGRILDPRLLVGCGEGAVRLLVLQRAGKKPLSCDAFMRGAPFAQQQLL